MERALRDPIHHPASRLDAHRAPAAAPRQTPPAPGSARTAGSSAGRAAEVSALAVQKIPGPARATGRARSCSISSSAGSTATASAVRSSSASTTPTGSCPSVRTSSGTPTLDRTWRISASRALQIASGKPASKCCPARASGCGSRAARSPPTTTCASVAFPQGDEPARPAWEVFFVKRLNEGYRTLIDAATGTGPLPVPARPFPRRQRVACSTTYPGAPKGGTHELRSFAGDPAASPDGWLSPVRRRARASRRRSGTTHRPRPTGPSTSFPTVPGQIRPLAPTGVFDFRVRRFVAERRSAAPTRSRRRRACRRRARPTHRPTHSTRSPR